MKPSGNTMRATNWRLDVWATSWTLSGEPRRAAYAAIHASRKKAETARITIELRRRGMEARTNLSPTTPRAAAAATMLATAITNWRMARAEPLLTSISAGWQPGEQS